jgi:hypothetical protein
MYKDVNVIDVKMDIGILIQIEVHFLQLIQFNVHFLSIGCETCKCNPIGAYNVSCSGVTGQHCDRCLPNHYGFSPEGCSRK